MEGTSRPRTTGEGPTRFERHPVATWLLILVTLGIAAELLLRVFDPEPVRFAKDFREIYRYHPRWYTDFEPDTTTTIRLTDELGGYYLNFLVTVNEFGFRWHDRVLDAPLPEARERPFLHAIGDSFTMGWGVNYESSYPALLDEALDARYTVVNLGLNGYGTIGATGKSMALTDRFPPSAVVYLFTENDYDDDVAAERHAARGTLVHVLFDALNALRQHSYLASLPYALRWWIFYRPARSAGDAPRSVTGNPPALGSADIGGTSVPDYGSASKRALMTYASHLRARQTPLIVIAHGDGPAAADFAAFCVENGIQTHLVAFDPSMRLHREGHLNRTGNRVLARYVQQLITQGPNQPR